jgi:F420-0:gamma-glutamyl ligase
MSPSASPAWSRLRTTEVRSIEIATFCRLLSSCADEFASAAWLVMKKAAGVPVALIHGFQW